MSLPDFTDVQWRNSGLMSRLGVGFTSIDARVFLFFILFLLHMKMWTLYLVLSAIVIFSILEYYGITLNIAAKKFRSFLAGRDRVKNNLSKRRRRFVNG